MIPQAHFKVDGLPVVVQRRIDDDNDHTILVVDKNFYTWLPVHPHFQFYGEPVVTCGEPRYWHAVTRYGYVLGGSTETGEDDIRRTTLTFDMHAEPGDSGAAIVDAKGQIVGVITGQDSQGRLYSFELAFDKEQIKAAE